jgi:hypothetical protein
MDGERRMRTSNHEVRDGRPVLGREAIIKVDKALLPAPAVALLETLFTPKSPLAAVLMGALCSAQTTPSLYGATSESGETAQKIWKKVRADFPKKFEKGRCAMTAPFHPAGDISARKHTPPARRRRDTAAGGWMPSRRDGCRQAQKFGEA